MEGAERPEPPVSRPSLLSFPIVEGRKTLLLIATMVLLSGCLGAPGNGGAEDDTRGEEPAVKEAARSNVTLEDPSTIVRVNQTSRTGFAADVLCQFGGGPKLDRVDGSRILVGTAHLEVEVELSATYTSLQVGYVLDSNGAEHAPENNRSIHWLPQVGPGEERTLTVSVNATQFEGEENRWAFYARMQPPGVDDVCYTGGGSGPLRVHIRAMP